MSSNRDEDLFEASTMTFGEHLDELCVALFRSVLGLAVGFLLGLAVANSVVHWITAPLENSLNEHYEKVAEDRLDSLYGDGLPEGLLEFMQKERLVFDEVYLEQSELKRLADDAPAGFEGVATADKDLAEVPLSPPSSKMVKTRIWRQSNSDVQALSTQEPFMIWLKAAFFSGLLIASPYIFYQLWSFVAAGLYRHEKQYVHIFLPVSLVLFWSGALMAFFFAFKYVLRFLFSFNRALDIQAEPRISEWIGFVLFLPLGFGIAFQLPLVMFFLNRIGLVSVKAYMEKWRIAILIIFVLSMILTPADPISMLLMACPLSGLYFLGIAMAQWMPRGRNPFTEIYEP